MCLKFCKRFAIQARNGKKIIIRRPEAGDAKKLLEYFNPVIEEDAPVEVTRKHTLKEERAWLKDKLDKIRKNKSHHLVAIYSGRIIGSVELRKGSDRHAHTAEYGITVSKDYRNLGIGMKMSQIILNIAKKDREIKIVYLRVFKTNNKAIRLYRKLGFRKIAVHPKWIKYKGKYIDEIVMDYPLR